ncbi:MULTISPECIES: hypothetical protein [unclassified Phyllobacterium]|uniref:hypothetical protein n=1 Tax=Phyllobacterium TaxID=28100 RepID=UPI000DDB5297|nr:MULTISPECIES: hypothetical protein [unclassified Phyllobacterium]MBA8899209.1 hypothetical protein [Phyllobacterium sp. P30BS-XVII]UGX85254.1 hypothetical protein LLE53_012325 [Phyllobacterium sp. T1293]
MSFANPPETTYSQDDWDLMQAAYDKAAATLLVKSSTNEEAKIIAETVMTAFNRGNRSVNSLAALAVITAVNAHPAVNGADAEPEKRYA